MPAPAGAGARRAWRRCARHARPVGVDSPQRVGARRPRSARGGGGSKWARRARVMPRLSSAFPRAAPLTSWHRVRRRRMVAIFRGALPIRAGARRRARARTSVGAAQDRDERDAAEHGRWARGLRAVGAQERASIAPSSRGSSVGAHAHALERAREQLVQEEEAEWVRGAALEREVARLGERLGEERDEPAALEHGLDGPRAAQHLERREHARLLRQRRSRVEQHARALGQASRRRGSARRAPVARNRAAELPPRARPYETPAEAATAAGRAPSHRGTCAARRAASQLGDGGTPRRGGAPALGAAPGTRARRRRRARGHRERREPLEQRLLLARREAAARRARARAEARPRDCGARVRCGARRAARCRRRRRRRSARPARPAGRGACQRRSRTACARRQRVAAEQRLVAEQPPELRLLGAGARERARVRHRGTRPAVRRLGPSRQREQVERGRERRREHGRVRRVHRSTRGGGMRRAPRAREMRPWRGTRRASPLTSRRSNASAPENARELLEPVRAQSNAASRVARAVRAGTIASSAPSPSSSTSAARAKPPSSSARRQGARRPRPTSPRTPAVQPAAAAIRVVEIAVARRAVVVRVVVVVVGRVAGTPPAAADGERRAGVGFTANESRSRGALDEVRRRRRRGNRLAEAAPSHAERAATRRAARPATSYRGHDAPIDLGRGSSTRSRVHTSACERSSRLREREGESGRDEAAQARPVAAAAGGVLCACPPTAERRERGGVGRGGGRFGRGLSRAGVCRTARAGRRARQARREEDAPSGLRSVEHRPRRVGRRSTPGASAPRRCGRGRARRARAARGVGLAVAAVAARGRGRHAASRLQSGTRSTRAHDDARGPGRTRTGLPSAKRSTRRIDGSARAAAPSSPSSSSSSTSSSSSSSSPSSSSPALRAAPRPPRRRRGRGGAGSR